jgi:hypothetical protein
LRPGPRLFAFATLRLRMTTVATLTVRMTLY